METDIDILKEQLEALRLQLGQERARRREALVLKHKRAYEKLRVAILDSQELRDDYASLIRELNLANFFALVAEINSPVGQRMGFSFLEVVYKAVDEILLPLDGGENRVEHKRRFGEVLKKVFNNPIATALINSNPVTGVIGKVVDLASGFVDSVIDRKAGSTIKKIKVATKEVITADRVEAFTDKMRKYEVLYGDLAKALVVFQEALTYVKASMRDSLAEYGGAHERLLELLALDEAAPFIGLDKVFQLGDKGWDGLPMETLEQIAADDRIVAALRFVDNMNYAESRLYTLRTQFTDGLGTFQQRFVTVLQRPIAENWEDVNVDRKALTNTIAEIKELSASSGTLMATKP